MRCPICGTADAACGAAPLEKPVLGDRTIQVVDAAGSVVTTNRPADGTSEPDAEPVPVAGGDVQVDD